MSNVPTEGAMFRHGQVAAYESVLPEHAELDIAVRRETATASLPAPKPGPQVTPVALWQVNDLYMVDPRRILDEHRPRWWQRLFGRCGCGARRPCPVVETALDVLFMRRRWEGYGDA